MANPFEYQVFISYNKGDLEWAQKIYDDLKANGYKPFLAPESIRTGQDWEATLLKALNNSQHLLAVWSSKSQFSPWVQHECGFFHGLVTAEKNQAHRRYFSVLLDQDNAPLGSKQAITDIKDKNEYPAGVRNVSTQVWSSVMNRIRRAISIDYSAVPVGLTILAMKKSRFQQLYTDPGEDFAADLNAMLPMLRARSVQEVMNNYGDEPKKWCPYGGSEDVETITERVMLDINQKVRGMQFRWEHPGDEFYTSTNQVTQRKALTDMGVNLMTVVIDLLSLYDSRVRDQLSLLSSYFADTSTTLMVLTPVKPTPSSELIDLIAQKANTFFQYFFDAPIGAKYANFGVNVCDERDVRRLLRATLAPHIPVMKETSSSAFI
jgi:hypothetical protein